MTVRNSVLSVCPVAKVGIPLLEQELRSLAIPDISGSASITVGKVDYKISK